MVYQVPKRTNTYAEVLEAIGLASLVEELTVSEVRILDHGDCFILEGKELPPVEQWPVVEPGYPFIYLKQDGSMPKGWVLDYEREKEGRVFAYPSRLVIKRNVILQALREQGLMRSSPVPNTIWRYSWDDAKGCHPINKHFSGYKKIVSAATGLKPTWKNDD